MDYKVLTYLQLVLLIILMFSCLDINNLEVSLRIGIDEEELSCIQDLVINLTIYFLSPPKACKTEKISDTICYSDVISHINDFCALKHYSLIESMANELFISIRSKFLSDNEKLTLQLCKKPNIINFKGNCCFTLSDKEI